MKKDEKKRPPRGASTSREIVRDWEPLFERLKGTVDWALDIATTLAKDYDEEVESIERVRSYMRGWLEGLNGSSLHDVCGRVCFAHAASLSPTLAPLKVDPTLMGQTMNSPTCWSDRQEIWKRR